jgi:hypothetical protein
VGSQDPAERCHSDCGCRGSNVQQPLLRVKERNTPKNGMIDVSFFVEACRGVGLPTNKREDAGPRFISNRPSPFSRAVLFALVCVLLLLLAFFGNWLIGSICDESRVATPFQGPFSSVCESSVCEQISPRDLLLKKATGYAI